MGTGYGKVKKKQRQFVTLMKKINQNLWCWLTKSSRVLVWVSGKYGLTEFSLEVHGKWCIVFCVNFKKMPVNQIYSTHHVKWTKDYDLTSRGQIKYWYWHMKWDTCKKTTDKTTDNRPWGNLELKFQSTETNLACITDNLSNKIVNNLQQVFNQCLHFYRPWMIRIIFFQLFQ